MRSAIVATSVNWLVVCERSTITASSAASASLTVEFGESPRLSNADEPLSAPAISAFRSRRLETTFDSSPNVIARALQSFAGTEFPLGQFGIQKLLHICAPVVAAKALENVPESACISASQTLEPSPPCEHPS